MKTFIKICPKCGSSNISIPGAGRDIQMIFPDHCLDCNNEGRFPEIQEDQIEEFKKTLRKKNENQ